MIDEPDPPRKIYGLKPREDFERFNETTIRPSNQPTDVQGLIQSANVHDLATKANAPVNRPNEVHAILQQNVHAARNAGLNTVTADPNYRSKQQRRVRRFFLFVLLFDVPVGLYAWKVGPANPVVFTFTIAASAYFTSRLAWQTFFLNTE